MESIQHDFYKIGVDETLKVLNTSTAGLDNEEASKRIKTYGYNEITAKSNFRFLKLVAKQFTSPLVYILLIAAIISYLTNHKGDAIVILGVIVINAIIGFAQEYRAERSMESLKKLIALKTKVIRGGELYEINARELVPGDIIQIEEGDKLPADVRLVESKHFRVLESAITGESIPTEKDTHVISGNTAVPDRKNMAWMSSISVSGKALGVVTKTGNNTIVGQIASSISNIKSQKSHFEFITSRLSKQMAVVAIVGAILIFVVGLLFRDISFEEIFLFSIASLVSSIPEGLPAVLTLVLAIGAYRMSKRNAIIRNLHASETLGIVNIIATDKTGTLTQNKMTITDIYLPDEVYIQISGNGWSNQGEFFKHGKRIEPMTNTSLRIIIESGFQSNSSKIFREPDGTVNIIGDPTEAAFLVLGEKAGLEYILRENVVADLAFNSEQRFRASLINNAEKRFVALGAPETLLDRSSDVLVGGKPKKITAKHRQQIEYAAKELSSRGLRVICIVQKKAPLSCEDVRNEDITGMTLIGLIGMKDPIRLEAKDAIAKAHKAGIRVMMLTGDHKETALSIAKELEMSDRYDTLTEDDLVKLSDDEFEHAVLNVNVLSRLSPEMKLRIAQVLQKNGNIIAMTGDGVNDAPALKQANVGISMGVIGTDTARESSEIILTDDNFATIVNAVEEGRVIFYNIRRAASFLITTNVAEQLTILVTLFLGYPLPLLASQILWLNLVTDGVNDVALATEKSHGRVLQIQPRNKNEGVLNRDTLFFVIIMSICMIIITVFFFNHYLADGIETARTAAFLCMSFTQLANAVNLRSLKQSIFKIGLFSNKYTTLGLLISFALTLAAIYLPFFQELLQFKALTFQEVTIMLVVSSLPLWVGEIIKFLRYKH